MLKTGILNPYLLSLLGRIRHTNTLLITDRGFPNWPGIETVDISLVDDLPRVLDVLKAVRGNFKIGHVWMAEEFLGASSDPTRQAFATGLEGLTVTYEPHIEFKKRAPHVMGVIRTADTTLYANMILESA
jgi:D-ribose pyranase